MNKAYELMKKFIPIQSMLKCKRNDDFLIISNNSGTIYYLNNVALDIWNLFDGHTSIEMIVEKMLSEYDVDKDTLENDLIDIIRDMQWKKIIRLKKG